MCLEKNSPYMEVAGVSAQYVAQVCTWMFDNTVRHQSFLSNDQKLTDTEWTSENGYLTDTEWTSKNRYFL